MAAIFITVKKNVNVILAINNRPGFRAEKPVLKISWVMPLVATAITHRPSLTVRITVGLDEEFMHRSNMKIQIIVR